MSLKHSNPRAHLKGIIMSKYLYSLPPLTEEEIKVLLLRINDKDCEDTLKEKIKRAIKLSQSKGDKFDE